MFHLQSVINCSWVCYRLEPFIPPLQLSFYIIGLFCCLNCSNSFLNDPVQYLPACNVQHKRQRETGEMWTDWSHLFARDSAVGSVYHSKLKSKTLQWSTTLPLLLSHSPLFHYFHPDHIATSQFLEYIWGIRLPEGFCYACFLCSKCYSPRFPHI